MKAASKTALTAERQLANAEADRLTERCTTLSSYLAEARASADENRRKMLALEQELHAARGLVDYERAQRITQRDRLIEYLLCAANPATAADTKRLAELQRKVAWPGELFMPQVAVSPQGIVQRQFDA